MPWLEDKLRPHCSSHAWVRDAIGVGLLIGLAAALSGRWGLDPEQFAPDRAVRGRMMSYYLLPALGLALALRQGAIDLSVWASAAVGGLVAAACVRAGTGLGVAALAGGVCGLSLGAANAAVVTFLRVPSPVVTLVVAVAAVVVMQAVVDGRSLEVPEDATYDWHLTKLVRYQAEDGGRPVVEREWLPLAVSRMLFVLGVYAAAVMGLIAASGSARLGLRLPGRWSLFASLCGSGLLASLGGVAWLVEHGSAPVLASPVGDLRIPAAAVLTGACLFSARNRSVLIALCAPVAMLVATTWRQHAWYWDMTFAGYALQGLQLTAMVGIAHAAVRYAHGRPIGKTVTGWKRRLPLLPAALAGAGLLTAGASGASLPIGWVKLLYVSGSALSLAALAWLAGASPSTRRLLRRIRRGA